MEFLEKLKKEAKKYSTIEELVDENYEKEGYKDIEFVERLSIDEHRWFILEENVYKTKVDGKDYYFGAWEVGSLKSEEMTVDDTGFEIEIFEVEKITKETFKRKED